MATICPSFLRGRVARFTRLDSCGRPVSGACNQVVTSGVISVEMSTEVEEGEEVIVKNFAGQLCISDKACDQVKWYTLTSTFCNVDPDLIQMINPSWRKILDENGDTIGWVENNVLDCSTGFALELWTEVSNAASVCDDPDAQGAWGYLLLPWVIGGVVGDLTVEDGAVQFSFTGRTKDGSRWGVGPYNVRLLPGTATPAPLNVIIQPKEHRLFMITTLTPPEPVCGCQTLTPITPPALEILSAVEGATDTTVDLSWTNWGAGPVTIDWDDGAEPNSSGPDTGSATHVFVNAGLHTITVTDADDVLRTDSVAVTTPFP